MPCPGHVPPPPPTHKSHPWSFCFPAPAHPMSLSRGASKRPRKLRVVPADEEDGRPCPTAAAPVHVTPCPTWPSLRDLPLGLPEDAVQRLDDALWLAEGGCNPSGREVAQKWAAIRQLPCMAHVAFGTPDGPYRKARACVTTLLRRWEESQLPVDRAVNGGLILYGTQPYVLVAGPVVLDVWREVGILLEEACTPAVRVRVCETVLRESTASLVPVDDGEAGPSAAGLRVVPAPGEALPVLALLGWMAGGGPRYGMWAPLVFGSVFRDVAILSWMLEAWGTRLSVACLTGEWESDVSLTDPRPMVVLVGQDVLDAAVDHLGALDVPEWWSDLVEAARSRKGARLAPAADAADPRQAVASVSAGMVRAWQNGLPVCVLTRSGGLDAAPRDLIPLPMAASGLSLNALWPSRVCTASVYPQVSATGALARARAVAASSAHRDVGFPRLEGVVPPDSLHDPSAAFTHSYVARVLVETVMVNKVAWLQEGATTPATVVHDLVLGVARRRGHVDVLTVTPSDIEEASKILGWVRGRLAACPPSQAPVLLWKDGNIAGLGVALPSVEP